jgi:type IV pilus biogenesis protein CpaD/CtpE
MRTPTTDIEAETLCDDNRNADGVFDDLAGPEAAVVKVEYVTVDPNGQAESAVIKVEYVTVDPDGQAETMIATF